MGQGIETRNGDDIFEIGKKKKKKNGYKDCCFNGFFFFFEIINMKKLMDE